MKHIVPQKHHSTIWFLLGIALLFFLLRLPSLFEPYWYGDEGIYHVVGDALRSGRTLYADIWDNKPPFLYITYALLGSDQFAIRSASLLFGIGAIISLYFLSQKLFQSSRASILSTAFFAFFFAIPMFEGNIANAENFMLFPIILAVLLFVTNVNEKLLLQTSRHSRKLFFISGFLFSFAFLYKIVAIFDVVALLLFTFFLVFSSQKRSRVKQSIRQYLTTLTPFFIGFLSPIIATIFYFSLVGAVIPFLQGAFASNIGYVGHRNAFFFPQGLLITKLLLLGIFITLLFRKRETLPRYLQFILLWLLLSVFNAFFSQRPYTHYVLVLLPAVSLLVGAISIAHNKQRLALSGLFLLLVVVVFQSFWIHKPPKNVQYYQNFLSYITGEKKTRDYFLWFDQNTPRDYDIATYIKMHTRPEESIFMWGNSAQIYTLSDKLPLGRYTVAYHILSHTDALSETNMLIQEHKPQFIFVLPDYEDVPIDLTGYRYIHMIEDTAVYEKNN